MVVFDASFANRNTKKSGANYGILVDQLAIYESRLESDGKLTPGDYKLLEQKAMSLYSHPGLSQDQRSNIEVKIASYRASGSKGEVKDRQDISMLNREIDDDNRKSSMLLGNNPESFLRAQAAIQSTRVAQLADAINTLDTSGDDPSAHLNEYNQALIDYQDTLEALNYVEQHVSGQAPSSDYVAYVTTNSRGEIIGVNVSREGAKSGYLETNGMYGGLKIYGKLNRKENGKNLFLLGNERFSAPDTMVPGPDGSLKGTTLSAESTQRGNSKFTIGQTGTFVDMDPNTVRTQQAIRAGGYAEGDKGFIYRKNEDGSYTKFLNSDMDQLGITENDLIKIPRSLEQSILSNVTETIDAATQPELPIPTQTGPVSPVDLKSLSLPAGPQSRAPVLQSRAPAAPTERAPKGALGVAQGAMQAAGSFLGGLFGGGK